MKKNILIGLKALIFLGAVFFQSAAFSNETIFVETGQSRIPFSVEIALTPAQQQQGLMFRQTLAPNQGMLFFLPNEQMRYMWMKNTLIALDMIFADSQGKIVSLHENARPLDETLISSEKPASVVLEVNAGIIRQHNIQVGDRILSDRLPYINR